MDRYYFYSPTNYRKEYKKFGTIAFELKAFFSEKAFSTKANKEIIHFKQIDDIDCSVSTKIEGQYKFTFEHSIDTCIGHFANSYKELSQDMAKWGYKPVSEKNYFRYRKLALKLLYRYSNFYKYWYGKNVYYYKNTYNRYFYDIELTAVHYHHRLHQPSAYMMKLLRQSDSWPYNFLKAENIDLHITKDAESTKDISVRFSIESNRQLNFSNARQRLRDAVFEFEYNKEITLHQYKRLRKFAKMQMFKNDELDISHLLKKQEYKVRILDK